MIYNILGESLHENRGEGPQELTLSMFITDFMLDLQCGIWDHQQGQFHPRRMVQMINI